MDYLNIIEDHLIHTITWYQSSEIEMESPCKIYVPHITRIVLDWSLEHNTKLTSWSPNLTHLNLKEHILRSLNSSPEIKSNHFLMYQICMTPP